jgi:putative lipase involved disintegration of autophagic bodies
MIRFTVSTSLCAIRGICMAVHLGAPTVVLEASGCSHPSRNKKLSMGLSPDFADKESRITVFFHINKPSHLGTSGGKGSISSGNVGCSDCCATSTFKEWPEKHRK